jgi:hypothetical protein
MTTVPPSADSLLAAFDDSLLDMDYLPPEGYIWLYDGPDFCVIVERSDGKQNCIRYYPDYLPGRLRPGHRLLNSLVDTAKGHPVAPFGFQGAIEIITQRDSLRVSRFPVRVTGEPVPVPDAE